MTSSEIASIQRANSFGARICKAEFVVIRRATWIDGEAIGKESTMISSNEKPESAAKQAPPFAGTVAGRAGAPAVENKDDEPPSPGAEADKRQAGKAR